jgi:hypothetical protein
MCFGILADFKTVVFNSHCLVGHLIIARFSLPNFSLGRNGPLYQTRMIEERITLFGGMWIDRRNRSTRRNHVQLPLCPPKNPTYILTNPCLAFSIPAFCHGMQIISQIGTFISLYTTIIFYCICYRVSLHKIWCIYILFLYVVSISIQFQSSSCLLPTSWYLASNEPNCNH